MVALLVGIAALVALGGAATAALLWPEPNYTAPLDALDYLPAAYALASGLLFACLFGGLAAVLHHVRAIRSALPAQKKRREEEPRALHSSRPVDAPSPLSRLQGFKLPPVEDRR